jgi:hypothetical protein
VVTNIGATGAPKVAWVMERMRGLYQFRRRRLKARGGYLADDGSQDRSLAYQRLVRELLEAQRREIVRLRNRGEISNEVMHRIERDLDLEDARLEIQDPTIPGFDPDPAELAGEGAIQPSHGALELALDHPMPPVSLVERIPSRRRPVRPGPEPLPLSELSRCPMAQLTPEVQPLQIRAITVAPCSGECCG